MPMPPEYAHASRDFDSFLADARDELGLATRNMAYTTVQAVLTVFRRRLSPDRAIAFAAVLPAVLRAVFVADWDLRDDPRPFAEPAVLETEVRALRRAHNFSPDRSIPAVARALRRHVDRRRFDAVLERIGPEAVAFWSAD